MSSKPDLRRMWSDRSMPTDDQQLARAAALAQKAAETAERLKPGTWESVQALALASIALRLSAETPDR
ncbi:hypothetical protein GCM10023340_06400 [Nocardioides marinquilinus]|uniref:Uncharacterized protein n=2 Tax=Nocardioides marinquilinus TaxID=1210400 RepID=A0ABP9P924_9ACTN